MLNRMKVSVIICTYHNRRYVDFIEAAESILEQAYDPVELVVVVDGNATVYNLAMEYLGSHENTIIYLNDQNEGVSYSRNKGVELASGEIVAFIDDDAIAQKDWIAELVAAYQNNNAIAVGGRMNGKWLVDRPRFLPAEFNWLVGVNHPGFGLDGEEIRNTFESNISFNRDIFNHIGGFNNDLGPSKNSYGHAEGAEIGGRLLTEYGRGVLYNEDAIVHHKVFEYRTQLRWLLSRAFKQGVSKNLMETGSNTFTSEESAFLLYLLFNRMPIRVHRIIQSPSLMKIVQTIMLFVFTATVGIGYIYGIITQN